MSNTKAIAFAQKIVDGLNEKLGDEHTTYSVDVRGVKYIRVVIASWQSRSVHLFVDADGNVYKAAGWKTPAKGIRFNVSADHGWDTFIGYADRFGGYLYR